MNRLERYPITEENFRQTMDALRAALWTALPAIVERFDAVAMTVAVQPSIQSFYTREGTYRALPLLEDVPVVFPGGGGALLTFPVRPGDECLVVFASRAIDSWWQSGGVQQPNFTRTHSLSDGFAFVGLRSRPEAVTVSTSEVQLRSDGGDTLIAINSATQAVRIVAPAGVQIVGNVTVQGDVVADGVSLKSHAHGNVQNGSGQSGGPL